MTPRIPAAHLEHLARVPGDGCTGGNLAPRVAAPKARAFAGKM